MLRALELGLGEGVLEVHIGVTLRNIVLFSNSCFVVKALSLIHESFAVIPL